MNAIVDYGMGNVGEIHNMFRRIGVESVVTDSAENIRAADQLVLPGVGGLIKTEQFQDPAYFGDPANALRIFNNN